MRKSDSPLASPTSLGALSDDLYQIVEEITEPATWRIDCRSGNESIGGYASRERATEIACRLMDSGCEVDGIGTGPGNAVLDREQVALIYANWVRARYH